VAGGDLAGFTILLDMQVDKDYWLGTYEPDLQAALRELVQPGSILYDVGANIGYVSLLLAKAAGRAGMCTPSRPCRRMLNAGVGTSVSMGWTPG